MCNPCDAVSDKDLLYAINGVKEAVNNGTCVTNQHLDVIDCDIKGGDKAICETIVITSKNEEIARLAAKNTEMEIKLAYRNHGGCGGHREDK